MNQTRQLRISEQPWRKPSERFVVEEYLTGFGDSGEGCWIEVCAYINLEVARDALRRYCEGPRVVEEITLEPNPGQEAPPTTDATVAR